MVSLYTSNGEYLLEDMIPSHLVLELADALDELLALVHLVCRAIVGNEQVMILAMQSVHNACENYWPSLEDRVVAADG